MKNPRIIISGGGTGGHIFPAISIANAATAELAISDAINVFIIPNNCENSKA